MSSPSTKTKTLTPETKKKIGRPSSFTPEKLQSLLDWMRAGKTMTSWCKQYRTTTAMLFNYMNNSEAGEAFRMEFTRAREDGAHALVDGTIDIADEMGTKNKPLDMMRQNLRVNTRQKIAGMWNRKQFGTRPGDGEGLARLTLGELVEEAMRRGAELAAGAPATQMLDVTPGATLAPMRDLARAAMLPPDDTPQPRKQRRTAT